jgi:hypothetical protein
MAENRQHNDGSMTIPLFYTKAASDGDPNHLENREKRPDHEKNQKIPLNVGN